VKTCLLTQYSFAHSPNGWTDGKLALVWIVDDFDAQTKDKANGQPRALFMDGHSLHYTPELLCFALDKNILSLGYPPHCTHTLQGLDVVCFAHMKLAWTEEVEKFEAKNSHGVTKVTSQVFLGWHFRERCMVAHCSNMQDLS
jgi:hypothetical protein